MLEETSLKFAHHKLFNLLIKFMELLKETNVLTLSKLTMQYIKFKLVAQESNIFLLKRPSLNMTKSTKLNTFLMKKNKLIIGQLNIKLNISHMSTLINLLTIFHKTESKKELNTKPLRNKSFTHQVKNKSFKSKDNKQQPSQLLYNNLLLLAES